MLFGTDFPLITPERWIKDFEGVAIKPEARPLIMKENAARLFGLAPAGSAGPARCRRGGQRAGGGVPAARRPKNDPSPSCVPLL